jgi:hypothetical protein
MGVAVGAMPMFGERPQAGRTTMKTNKTRAEASPATKAARVDGKSATRPAKSDPAKKATNPKKLSAIDAAAKVLGESGQPMRCLEMIEAMAKKGYWRSPGGKTPAATLYTVVTMLTKAS